jgi:hypothetical protein
MTNAFASADPWTVGTSTLLPAGNHVVEIAEIDDSERTKGGYFQWKIKVRNDSGELTDWMAFDPQSGPRKLMGLANAAGVAAPQDDEVGSAWGGSYQGPQDAINPAYKQKFIGKTVGVVARDEPKFNDPTKTQTRVQGYVDAKTLGGGQAQPSGNAFQGAGGQAAFGGNFNAPPSASPFNDDIPF